MKAGDRVAIVRRSLHGWWLEGYAQLVRPLWRRGYWRVRFPGGVYAKRRVIPEAQGNAEEWVALRNGKRAE